jgi:hypothetical protein
VLQDERITRQACETIIFSHILGTWYFLQIIFFYHFGTNKISQKILYKPKTCLSLYSVVKGNTLANAFPIHIDGNSLVGDLKEVIKEKNAQTFANVA